MKQRLVYEHKKCDDRISEHMKTSQFNPPLWKGVSIFDEVKVAAKLHWNNRNGELLGHLMYIFDATITINDPGQYINHASRNANFN